LYILVYNKKNEIEVINFQQDLTHCMSSRNDLLVLFLLFFMTKVHNNLAQQNNMFIKWYNKKMIDTKCKSVKKEKFFTYYMYKMFCYIYMYFYQDDICACTV